MVLNLFFCAWMPKVDCLLVGVVVVDDAFRLRVGAALRLNEGLDISG